MRSIETWEEVAAFPLAGRTFIIYGRNPEEGFASRGVITGTDIAGGLFNLRAGKVERRMDTAADWTLCTENHGWLCGYNVLFPPIVTEQNNGDILLVTPTYQYEILVYLNGAPKDSADLFRQLEGDIRCDGHPTETAYNRSDTKRTLLEKGPGILAILAGHLKNRFPNMETSKMPRNEVDWDMFGVWVWFIADMRKKYNLPATPYPGVPFGKQDIREWHDYCLRSF